MSVEASELKGDLGRLHNKVATHYTLLREISSILGTVSSTLMASNQISAHERESLISRLESINASMVAEHRELGAILDNIKRAMDDMERDLSAMGKAREASDETIQEILQHAQAIAERVDPLHVNASETLKHARKLVDRDPESGIEMSRSDKILKALGRDFWASVRIAFLLKVLSDVLPWIRGIKMP